ncbi:MAG: tetratricopeptide repeat protein [Pyrinomonadaceae bacterium]
MSDLVRSDSERNAVAESFRQTNEKERDIVIAGRGKVKLPRISVRASSGGYLLAATILTFAAFILLHAGKEIAASIFLCFAWLVVPFLAFTDRIVFDGDALIRRGFVALLLNLFNDRQRRISVREIERIETNAVRTLRRSGRVRYRYRSEVSGNGVRFILASGGGTGYRRMVAELFPRIGDDKLDARTTELRDYLSDAKSLQTALGALRVAPASVLEDTVTDFARGRKRRLRVRRRALAMEPAAASEVERGKMLQRAGNELRVGGRLSEAAEAFRRALLVTPHDATLLYDSARLLRSQASMMNDARLLKRARAALQIAARRAPFDHKLLSRIGESFLETGDFVRAAVAFRRALNANPNTYRAELGLAEIALRTGKLAHVVHHYGGAARVANDSAAARFATHEADYYARLNSDDDYLAVELRRIGWLQHLHYARRIAARATFTGIGLAIAGAVIDELLGDAGWALASSAIVAWIGVVIAEKFFRQRRETRHAEPQP